jgi:uncharacterized membrane protein YcaP (DUF421 family)
MHQERVNEEEVLSSAREKHGIGSMDEIDHAVLETDGAISVIPRKRTR